MNGDVNITANQVYIEGIYASGSESETANILASTFVLHISGVDSLYFSFIFYYVITYLQVVTLE